MKNNFEVLTDEVTTVRDLSPDDSYITCRDVKKYGAQPQRLWRRMRIRTDDPFFSTTIHGTRTHSIPSDKVYRVRELEGVSDES